MTERNPSISGARRHIVLVPGFGGFDALGQVEYYAGITRLFQQWQAEAAVSDPLVLHYFDNLPTAAVVTRAARLRRYLAKRIVRGEIRRGDKVVLVGHSTGGLDIRQLIWSLHRSPEPMTAVDGGRDVAAEEIRQCLDGVIFLSTPHWGTNIADWVRERVLLRKAVVAELRAALAGSQAQLLDRIELACMTAGAALIRADILLAFRDAITEANSRLCGDDPSRVAAAQEAASEMALYLRQMATDFHVIDDLTAQVYDSPKSPAHFKQDERRAELEWWDKLGLRTLSYATVGGRPFRFASPSKCPAPAFDVTIFDFPELAHGSGLSACTDISYRLCYHACAGGPLRWPLGAGTISRVLGPTPPLPLELWDNDGIVNTVSMLWPRGETVLVQADHLDIVGHYHLRFAAREAVANGSETPRTYRSYDSLRSKPILADATFEDVWGEVFSFCAEQPYKKSRPRPVALAAGVATSV